METKVLVVAIIEKDGKILLRKKPDGSPPYTETWYIFGAKLVAGQDIEATLQSHVRAQAGIGIQLNKQLGWDTEVKADLDGVVKQFVYLDVSCRYVSGELRPASGIEKLEWVATEDLVHYDNVPPSKKLFKKLGYIS